MKLYQKEHETSILIFYDIRRRDGLDGFLALVGSGLRHKLPERLDDRRFAVAVLPGVSRRVKK